MLSHYDQNVILWLLTLAVIVGAFIYNAWAESKETKDKQQARKRRSDRFANLRNERKQ